MAILKAGKLIIAVGIIAIFIIAVLGSSGVISDNFDTSGQDVSCTVTVEDTLLSDVEISSASCEVVGTCFANTFSIFDPGSYFTEDVDVQLYYSGKVYGTESVRITQIVGEETLIVRGCLPSSANSVDIRALSEEGVISDIWEDVEIE